MVEPSQHRSHRGSLFNRISFLHGPRSVKKTTFVSETGQGWDGGTVSMKEMSTGHMVSGLGSSRKQFSYRRLRGHRQLRDKWFTSKDKREGSFWTTWV